MSRLARSEQHNVSVATAVDQRVFRTLDSLVVTSNRARKNNNSVGTATVLQRGVPVQRWMWWRKSVAASSFRLVGLILFCFCVLLVGRTEASVGWEQWRTARLQAEGVLAV